MVHGSACQENRQAVVSLLRAGSHSLNQFWETMSRGWWMLELIRFNQISNVYWFAKVVGCFAWFLSFILIAAVQTLASTDVAKRYEFLRSGMHGVPGARVSWPVTCDGKIPRYRPSAGVSNPVIPNRFYEPACWGQMVCEQLSVPAGNRRFTVHSGQIDKWFGFSFADVTYVTYQLS